VVPGHDLHPDGQTILRFHEEFEERRRRQQQRS